MSQELKGKICGSVVHGDEAFPIRDAQVSLYKGDARELELAQYVTTDRNGKFCFDDVPGGTYQVVAEAFGNKHEKKRVQVSAGDTVELGDLTLSLGYRAILHEVEAGGTHRSVSSGTMGRRHVLRAEHSIKNKIAEYRFAGPSGFQIVRTTNENEWEFTPLEAGQFDVEIDLIDGTPGVCSKKNAEAVYRMNLFVAEAAQFVRGEVGVRLQRAYSHPTLDQALWVAIRNRTHALHFAPYQEFVNRVFEGYVLKFDRERTALPSGLQRQLDDVSNQLKDVRAYEILQLATDAFLLAACGVKISDPGDRGRFGRDELSPARLGHFESYASIEDKLSQYLGNAAQLPYISRVVRASFPEFEGECGCHDRVLTACIDEPCLIELIWSYWHEEGMLVQSMNAITQRFKNVQVAGTRDPLAHLEITPLRALNNVIWGWAGDELNRLSIRRRAYEYEHEYGLRLYGRVVRGVRPADTRSKFLEAFHNLLNLCSAFYKEDNDTTVIADGYPLLNALKEVHLLLAQGAHNQFRDLPWVARREMMMQQWILARPELREFLQSRAMVPYKEGWMPQVDTMKSLQGWTDVTVTHFRDLGVYGEEILLSVRYGDWIGINDEDSAKNWARFWRAEIQAYLHAYRAVTGIDLTNPDTVDATVPAIHLRRRLATQQGAH
jgi:hypothetical protein